LGYDNFKPSGATKALKYWRTLVWEIHVGPTGVWEKFAIFDRNRRLSLKRYEMSPWLIIIIIIIIINNVLI